MANKQQKPWSHFLIHFLIHNSSTSDHMNSLILKRITFHRSVHRFVLQSHFDMTSNWCDDLSFKCTECIFYVSILKGIPDGHDCCGEKAKTVFKACHCFICSQLSQTFILDDCVEGDFATVRISTKFLQLLSNEDKKNNCKHFWPLY